MFFDLYQAYLDSKPSQKYPENTIKEFQVIRFILNSKLNFQVLGLSDSAGMYFGCHFFEESPWLQKKNITNEYKNHHLLLIFNQN